MTEKKIKAISSVSEYLSIVEQIQRDFGGKQTKTPILFRGETCYNKSIYASLFRDDIKAKEGTPAYRFKNIDEESLLYQEAERMFPSIFNDCRDSLDKMVKMQHYGLPTRLLDVTENPLVALYFACADYKTAETKDKGRVFYENELDYADSNIFEIARKLACLAENIKESSFKLSQLDSILQIKDTKKDRISTYICLRANLELPFLFKPPILNDRLRAQQGAFIFSPFAQLSNFNYETSLNDVKQDIDSYLEQLKELLFEKKAVSLKNKFNELCVIPVKYKESIINELDKLGVNMATLFPDEEHQMRYVYDKYVRGKKTDRYKVAKIDNL